MSSLSTETNTSIVAAINSLNYVASDACTSHKTAFRTPTAYREGKIVEFYGEWNGQTPANTLTLVATIPESYRPSDRRIFGVTVGDGSEAGISGNGFVVINSDGTVRVSVNANGFVAIHCVYMIS